jgi:outer membrane protein assembly factor BamB
MLALDSGQLWWSHDMSSYRGLAIDDENLYVTQSDGVVVAMRQRDGSELWRNEKLKRRGLSAPIVSSTAIAVADFQGYVHWLDKNTGELVARERVAKKQRVSNPPAGADGTIVILTDGGTLAAYRPEPRTPNRPAAAATPAAPVPGPADSVPPPAATPPPAPEPAATPPP